MRKQLLLPLFAMAALPAIAARISPEQALQRLSADKSLPVPALTRSLKDPQLQILDNLYLFTSGQGFVVLPAFDEAPPLLAYSEVPAENTDILDNPGVRYWLDFYNAELAGIDSYSSPEIPVSRSDRRPIAPLLKTRWNQEYPYNLLCPKVDGHATVTGCVATAMAQIMKFHNYPEHGEGSHSYLWRPGEEELSFDYSTTPFQWNLMTDTYDDKSSEESRHAVAELMYACGVSVNMHYEPGGSGAATTQMGVSLIDIFNYSPSLWMPRRAFYGYYEWEDMIYADLEQGLPVLYSGAGTAGGHQFICDGYSSDGFFHFNWGWGGLSDGYFLLTALNPDGLGVGGGAGGFNSSQVATLGVRPKKEGDTPVYLFYNDIGFEAETTDVEPGKDFRCTGQYFNYSLVTMPAGSRLGMKFESDDNSVVKFVEGPGVDGYRPDDGRYDLQVVFPELPDGSYRVTPVLHVNGKWHPVRMPVGEPSHVSVTVAGGKISVENQHTASIVVKEISLPSVIYRDHDFPMAFTVENTGEEEFYSTVTPILTDADGKVVAVSEFRPVDVLPGAEETVKDYVGRFAPEKDETLEAGTYTLIFRDEAGRYVSMPMEVTLAVNDEKTAVKISGFRIDEKEPITDPSAVKIRFTVSCESGVYYDAPVFRVFPGSGGYQVFSASPEKIYLTPGESKEVSFTADMDRLKDGWYMCFIYEGSVSVTDQVDFHIDREAAAVDAVPADSALLEDPSAEFYRLDGTKVDRRSLLPGVYIVRTSGSTFKIRIR